MSLLTPTSGRSARGPITFGIMLATVMSALDMTVVNVALPHMQGNLSASSDQITWVLTSYIVAVAVMTPVSGWLVARFGLKSMLMVCVGGFTVTSVLCGMATSLPQIVLFRLAQGVLAAPLMPIAQAVLMNINPPERLGRAMAIFTMASVVAPAVGPVVGGFLTEDYSWRWCFFINVPAGIGSMVLLWLFLPADETSPRRFDFLGFGSLALAVGAFQLMLDRGTTKDWFGSTEICVEAAIAFGAFCVYLAHTFTTRNPLFPPALFRDRNLIASTVFGFFLSVLMFCSLTLLPVMMQGVLGYSVIHSGMLSMPRGLIMLGVLQVAGRLDVVVNRQLLVAIGLGFLVISFWMMSLFDLSMSGNQIISATSLQGVGQGIMFVPLATLGFATIPQALRADASALSNLLRNMGGSVGVATVQALTVVNTATMHASMAAHITASNPLLAPDSELPGAMAALNAEITRQATMVAFVDDFRLMAVLGLMCFALLLLLRQPRPGPAR
jgi:DHA2 family multidrug resistance protein